MQKISALPKLRAQGIRISMIALAIFSGWIYVGVLIMPDEWRDFPQRLAAELRPANEHHVEALSPPPSLATRAPADMTDGASHLEKIVVTGSKPNFGADSKLTYAFYLSSFIVVVSTVVLFVSLACYLFSKNKGRIERSGGIVKTSLGFLITSGAGVMAFLGFVVPRT